MANEFLKIDGYELLIFDGSAKIAESEVGDVVRGANAQLHDAVIARPRVITAVVPFDTNLKLENILQLIRGRGHHFPFDTSYYSDGGVGPNSGYTGCSLGTATPSPKFGTRRLAITSGNSWTVTVDVPLGDTWTVHFWHQVVATGVWTHYAVTKDGAGTTVKYISGAASGSTVAMYSVSVSGTSLTLTLSGKNAAGTNADAWFDDLVILPWAANATQIAAWAAQTVAASPFPNLNLKGLLLGDSTFSSRTIVVRGAVGQIATVQGSIGGTFYTNLLSAEVSFTEVSPYR